jgi:plastocyanin
MPPTIGGLAVQPQAVAGEKKRHMPRATAPAGLAAAALVLLALAGCGSSSTSTSTTSSSSTPTQTAPTSSTPAPGGALSLAANPEGQLKYEQTSLTAKAGTVTINFTNASPVGHNVTIASSAGAVLGATPIFSGGSKTLSVHLKAGTYKFYCSVPGHRMAGMEGTLTVN